MRPIPIQQNRHTENHIQLRAIGGSIATSSTATTIVVNINIANLCFFPRLFKFYQQFLIKNISIVAHAS